MKFQFFLKSVTDAKLEPSEETFLRLMPRTGNDYKTVMNIMTNIKANCLLDRNLLLKLLLLLNRNQLNQKQQLKLPSNQLKIKNNPYRFQHKVIKRFDIIIWKYFFIIIIYFYSSNSILTFSIKFVIYRKLWIILFGY